MRKKGLTSRQMSSMYRKLKRKMPKKVAFRTVGKAKVLSKKTRKGKQSWVKKKYPYLDFDGDRVVNKYDCQPLNKWKQDKIRKAKKGEISGTGWVNNEGQDVDPKTGKIMYYEEKGFDEIPDGGD